LEDGISLIRLTVSNYFSLYHPRAGESLQQYMTRLTDTVKELREKVDLLSQQVSFLTLQVHNLQQANQETQRISTSPSTATSARQPPRSGPLDIRIGDAVEFQNRYQRRICSVRVKNIEGDKVFFDLDGHYTWRLRKDLKRLSL